MEWSRTGLDASEGFHSTSNSFNIEFILFMHLFLYDGAMTNLRFGSFCLLQVDPENSYVLMIVGSDPFNCVHANLGLLALQVGIRMGLLLLS